MIKYSIVILLAALSATQRSQAEVVYVNGPSFQIPGDYAPAQVDLNSDGISESYFASSSWICTADVPTSGCSSSVYANSGESSQFLMTSNAPLQASGVWISGVVPDGTSWGKTGAPAYLVTSYFSPRYGTGGQSGSLATLGVGYIGVRFHAADGLHYGWVRVRMPHTTIATNGFPLELTPVVVDWAYETSPDTAILAGAGIDSDSDGVWDLIDECSESAAGEVVNARGCSIQQLVPCDGPWKNHGEYITRMIAVVAQFQKELLITKAEARVIMRDAVRSDCGKNRMPRGNPENQFPTNVRFKSSP